MSNTAVVKVYGSSKKQELLAMIPVGGDGMAQPDDVLIDFAESQIRRRFPTEKLDASHFRIERKYTPYPRHTGQSDRTDAHTASAGVSEDHPDWPVGSPSADRVETQNGLL
jgi:hypothetical protein